MAHSVQTHRGVVTGGVGVALRMFWEVISPRSSLDFISTERSGPPRPSCEDGCAPPDRRAAVMLISSELPSNSLLVVESKGRNLPLRLRRQYKDRRELQVASHGCNMALM